MKNKISLVFLILFSLISLQGIAGVQAIFNYKQFMAPSKDIYIESYLSFISSSLKYKNPGSKVLQARLLVTQYIKQEGVILDFKKYQVLGPVLQDSVAVDFKDQKRFVLVPGYYQVEIEIVDLNDTSGKATITTRTIHVDGYDGEINVSDIELIDYFKKTEKNEKNEFSKSGFDIYPMVSNYLPTDVEKLAYYFEIYNNGPTEPKVLITQFVETYSGNKLLPNYLKRTVKNLKQITPIMGAFNISKLPTGNYNLVIEVRDSANVVIAKDKVFVQRVNSNVQLENLTLEVIAEEQQNSYLVFEDSIDYFLESMSVIGNSFEYNVLKGDKTNLTYEMKQNYFANFWQSRYGVDAISQWNVYKALIYEAENKYGTKLKRGFETDMGRILIKYGKPSDVEERLNEQASYPYIIWHYYQTNNQSNVMFVFYNPSAVSKDFELLHSTMQGELVNRDWKTFVNMRAGGSNSRLDLDERRMR